jgi:hypothetical protein
VQLLIKILVAFLTTREDGSIAPKFMENGQGFAELVEGCTGPKHSI